MDTPDNPKPRRPLPTPGASSSFQRPSTPVSASPVPPSTFYAPPASQKPPPLPQRRKTPGSNHTAYMSPEPPRYGLPTYGQSTSYRQPEIVQDDAGAMDDEDLPALIPTVDNDHWQDSQARYDTSTTAWKRNQNWVPNAWEYPSDPTTWATIPSTSNDFNIDGRSETEESLWYDPEERARNERPGPGMLPPVMTSRLHNPNHSIYYAHVTPPTHLTPISSGTPQPSGSSASPADCPQPSDEEVRMAVPHPHAHYCPRDNGWVILMWKSSTMPPPLARSFQNSPHPPLPDQRRRRRVSNCIEGDAPYGKAANRTHHFHKYERAIDSLTLTTPYKQDEWQILEDLKHKRRAGSVMRQDLDVKTMNIEEHDLKDDDGMEEEGKLFDLYICCQCSFYCIASPTLPGVIPRKHLDELARDKKAHPPVGKTPEASIVLAIETFLLAIENKLWKGNHRMIKFSSPGFMNKLGWNPNIKRIFELLGFVEESAEKECALKSPPTDVTSAQGRANRRKLLRAWVELSAWLADFKRIHSPHIKDIAKEHRLCVSLDNAREEYQTAIGAQADQIPRGLLPRSLAEIVPLKSLEDLGLTDATYSPELLAFAYLAQCRCDPANTPTYFTHLTRILQPFQQIDSCPSLLQELLVMEQSRDRFTLDDIQAAAHTLGFGSDNVLRVDYGDDVDDAFLEGAWRAAVKRSWTDPTSGAESNRLANESFRVLAEARGSMALRKIWETGKNTMTPDRAYDTLEIPRDVDDDMVITVYSMRIEETPHQLDKFREAMAVIAEIRNSERLKQFLSTGQDPGVILAPTRPDFPRGLNQLGNTCYLNSLLQYFYTIKDLREAVLPMSKLDIKALDDEKFSDEDLKRHRVGGRLVTRREIVRSRKFVGQLAELFSNLEYAEAAAVTPTIELAKLALVTSKDEEEDEGDRSGTDSSNDTDATLVEDGPPRGHTSQSPGPSSSSSTTILGKRFRDVDRHGATAMEIDSPISGSPKEKDGFVMVPSAKDEAQLSRSQSKAKKDADQKAKAAAKKRTTASDSTMMFGKQHDVAECMDNCMFQIETALLRFDDMSDDNSKRSVVKRLFYGKIRQRITPMDNLSMTRPSLHEKEDLFSHLPVNVTDDGIDIYDGLSGYFDDSVEFEGRKARMEMNLVDLPPILQIQLQRVQFNRETLQPYKSQAYVKFSEDLYMDRFLDTADPARKARAKAIQAELTACRERARLLSEGKDNTPFSLSLLHTSKFLKNLKTTQPTLGEEDLAHQLDDEHKRIRHEIDTLRAQIDALKEELEALWKDCREAAYQLTSVFIHRGSSPSFGHYFFYSRHLPDAPDSWFKYNDSDVTLVSKDEVLADTTGSTANPYLLVFARKGVDLVDTVKRYTSSTLST